MKNKSTRHKADNIFKFLPFSERIASLDLNVIHHVPHVNETQIKEERECLFYQAIIKWNVLNLTESYSDFKRDANPLENVTLPQLICNKNNIVEVLLKHLKHKDSLCLQPLLEILVAVAHDLQAEFYGYYEDVLHVLIDLLNTKDTEQLEWTFTCLAYLFKSLWRILVKDIDNVFNTLLPLLSDRKPEYINNFAAQSFAFVARKVKDRKAFLLVILRSLKNVGEAIPGCGRLLFEIVKGVNEQFHSCADIWLSLYFSILQEEKTSRISFNILEEIVRHIVHNIELQNAHIFWKILTDNIHQVLSFWQEERKEVYLDHILKLAGLAIEYRNGYFLSPPEYIIKELLVLFSMSDITENIILSAVKIVILLMLAKNVRLQQEQASSLITRMLQIQSKDIFLFFVENMFDYSSFELSILPAFLQYCVESKLNEAAFLVLSKLLMTKSPMCGSGIDIDEWCKYPLNFFSSQNNTMIEKILLKHIDEINMPLDTSNYVLALICVAHINCSVEIGKVLLKNIQTFCNIINSGVNVRKNLFLLLTSFECMVHTTKSNNLVVIKDDLMSCLLPLCTNTKYISALKLLDMYITVAKEDFVNMDNLLLIHKSLKTNFSSPYDEVRLYTTHLYSIFDETLQLQINNQSEQWHLFSLCYKIQSIEPDVQNYREQLLYLDKFNFDRPQISMCKTTEFRTVPLRFLCGSLYMNFKLLWEPIIKIIASHADGLDKKDFWEVYLQELRNVVANIRNMEDTDISTCEYDNDFVNTLYENTYKINIKPNFANYRLLIWKAIALSPQIAEANTRDVSVLLLDFVENEYIKYNGENMLTCNIKQNNPLTEDVPEEDNLDKTLQEESKLPKRGKANLRNLMQHLEVFTKIRSPKSMYREPELYKLYFNLLCHKNPDVQRIALDCIMTYRFKYLIPYKEHLYNLIDDKKLKNELITFKIDKELGMIQEEHRDHVIPIIMRLVYSKMMSRIGLRTGGKSSGQFRRSIIFRFIAGCQENEMMNFTYMSFKYYQEFIKSDPVDMISSMTSTIDLENFVPLKQLQSALNLMQVILEQFGTLMGNELLSYLLKILLVIGNFIKVAFIQQNSVHVGFFPLLRNVRTLSIKAIDKIFSLFENYPWTTREINAIFDVFIWPYLKKLHIEGIHSPTALLKLLVRWGNYPRYFCLLNKHHEDDVTYYPLSAIISLLSYEKSHVLVTNLIMEMLEKLLYLQPDDMDIQLKISIENELPFSENIKQELKCKTSFNYGSMILLPHAANILEKVKYKLEKKSRNINQRDLFILSRISELVHEADISDKLLEVLLPVVLKKCILSSSEETLLQLMNTLNNLMKNIEMPEKHLKLISPLFSEVVYPSSRKLLIEQLNIIAKNQVPKFTLINEIMTQINAWDSKWIDEPDFQIRGDAFRKIQRMINEGDITLELGVLLIYNCFHILKNVKDLALRENASHCLKTLAPHLVNGYLKQCDRCYLVDEVLLALIRYGLRSKNDDIRNECISLLGHLSRNCAAAHVVLKNLHKLTNKLDLEVDFFENLTHLQIHRHGRALQKFTNVYKLEITPPHIRSLTQFVLPLTTHYLCNIKYSNKNSVVDASIEALGMISKLLPWHQYEGLLKFYLSKLRQKIDFQKQLVRVVVAILDSFHFDISKGQNWDVSKAVKEINNDNVESRDHLAAEKSDIEQKNDHDVDEILDSYNLDIEKENEEDEAENAEDHLNNKVHEKITILCKSAATRAIYTIQVVLLPQLHKTLAEMTQYESSHKVNRKKTSIEKEEEDLQRVPISLALVKLLQRLPKKVLDINLPGIFMKLCTFLKSHLDSVRRIARETLQKIMTSLGPQYLHLLLNEIVPLLSRGFHVHVLVYTVHSVLVSLKEMFKPGDVDTILVTVVKLCKADLFGSLSEEKEIGKIINKISEAKSTKSLDTFYILGQYVTETCLMDLILPIKETLSTNQTFKIISKAQDSLRHIALGLVENRFVTIDSLLKFSYGIASESISVLFTMKETALTKKERPELEKKKIDCYIIPKAPAYRSGHKKTIKISNKTNTYIIIEFGIRLCYLLLKREKVKGTEFKPLLDPFVVIFKDCLPSENVKLRVVTLQCLEWIFRYDLPSLRDNVGDIVQVLFQILHQYGAAGLSKGDNFDLVVAAFKVITVLVRDVKFYVMEPEQLKILLLYVEQDLYHQDRQAIAFGLLKSILSRRLNIPELYDITLKVSELSIISELPHIRLQSRLVMHQFLMDYPLGKKLDKYISFYLSQLKYETQDCRKSAIDMIHTLITSFPVETLNDYSGTFLVTLGARLINDSEPTCRKMIADCITSLFDRLLKQDRDPLFNIIKLWFNEENVIHQQLAAQLCGILVTVEKTTFETRISILLPLIKYQLGINQENFSPGKFVQIEKEDEMDLKSSEKIKDHQLFHLLQLLLKIFSHCPTILNYIDDVEEISKSVQLLLSYPHDWVRLSAAQFLGFVLSSVDICKLQNLLLNNTCSKGYLLTNPIGDITSLSLDLCSQLQSNDIKNELAEQVVKNLVFIARALENIPVNDTKSVNLLWLARRMRKIVNFEIVETPTSITLRTVVFKWIAGVVTVIDIKNLLNILHHLLAPVVREMVTEENYVSIKHLSKEISNLIKKKIGVEKYTEVLSRLEQKLLTKRTERKRLRNQLAVTDPEAFARKKIKLNEKKKQTKKRKINERKASVKKFKRKKVEHEEGIM